MRWAFAHSPDQAAPAPDQLPRRDIWFGAHPLHSEPPPHQRGDASFVAQVIAIPADLDWADESRRTDKALPDEATVRLALRALGRDLQPSIVVHSGHGLQPWWLLDSPVAPDLGAELVARLSARLAEAGIENGRQDLASILRLPGSTNWKNPERPVPVTVESAELGRRFTPEWIRRYVPLPRGWTAGPVGGGTRHRGGGAITDGQLDVQNYVIEHHSGHSPQGRGGVIYLWRPGKDRHGGHSATILVGDQGEAILTVFSSNWAGIGPDNGEPSWSWVLRGDRLVRAHLADREELDALLEAGDALDRVAPPPPLRPIVGTVTEDDDEELVADDFSQDDDEEVEIVSGLIIAGRWTQLVATAKAGKSTLAAVLSLAVAHGVDPFDGSPQVPVPTLWMNGEMGRADLVSLIEAGGYEPAKLGCWTSVSMIPRLDVPDGAEKLLRAVDRGRVRLVVLDGLNSFLSPGRMEKDDDGWRSLFRLTIQPLKARGVAVVSTDNLGKDPNRGSRGSSVKTDKADAVVAVARKGGGVVLRATHRRTHQFADEVVLLLDGLDGSMPLTFRPAAVLYPEGTADALVMLRRLDLPIDAGRRRVRAAMEEHKGKALADGDDPSVWTAANDALGAAMKLRAKLIDRVPDQHRGAP